MSPQFPNLSNIPNPAQYDPYALMTKDTQAANTSPGSAPPLPGQPGYVDPAAGPTVEQLRADMIQGAKTLHETIMALQDPNHPDPIRATMMGFAACFQMMEIMANKLEML